MTRGTWRCDINITQNSPRKGSSHQSSQSVIHFRSLLTFRLGFSTPTCSFSFFFFFFFFSNFLQEQSFAEGVFKIRRRLIYTYENWLDIISTTKRCLFYEPWKFKSSLLIFSHWQQLVWWAPPIRCRLAMLKWFIMIHHLWWLMDLPDADVICRLIAAAIITLWLYLIQF